jgi:hypothetical protein
MIAPDSATSDEQVGLPVGVSTALYEGSRNLGCPISKRVQKKVSTSPAVEGHEASSYEEAPVFPNESFDTSLMKRIADTHPSSCTTGLSVYERISTRRMNEDQFWKFVDILQHIESNFQ